jgi:uncharacterized protein YbjT (DUF2867 family)
MSSVMGITGKVGGATAEHLLAHGKKVRALVRDREKASSWANHRAGAQRRRRRVRHVAGCPGALVRLQRSQGRDDRSKQSTGNDEKITQ